MDIDDVVYLALLVLSIGFGYVYRRIEDKENKKWIGTGVGFLIISIVSGTHIFHSIVSTIVNTVIILFTSKKKCHLISFIFSFCYLIFFRTTVYFGIPSPPAHTNLVQMMLTLKLVGLAFEVNSSNQLKKDDESLTIEEKSEIESNTINPSFMDIFHYSFNYIGILTGPYYRYRTLRDSFDLPFHKYVSWKDETVNKLTYIPLFMILFLISTYFWPISYATTEEFYKERSFLYRFGFCWPTFFIFRMRMYIGLVLSECVCTMASLGAYPVKTNPKPGLGPSSNFEEMSELIKDAKKLETEKYNFDTILNINPYGADFCTTFRDGMKHWNICIQYWLAVNVYKRFPSKQYRTLATLFVSALWHGVYLGYYVCICGVPFYLPVEDVYVKLFLKENKGISLKIWEWIIWFFKMQAFSYLAVAFHLLSIEKVMHYYHSTYYVGFIFAIIAYLIGLGLLKVRKTKKDRSEQIVSSKD